MKDSSGLEAYTPIERAVVAECARLIACGVYPTGAALKARFVCLGTTHLGRIRSRAERNGLITITAELIRARHAAANNRAEARRAQRATAEPEEQAAAAARRDAMRQTWTDRAREIREELYRENLKLRAESAERRDALRREWKRRNGIFDEEFFS